MGTYDGSLSVKDYAAGAGKNFLEQLSAWRPYEGFVFSLLLSSHSALTSEIRVDRLKNEDLGRAYDYIARLGDVISRLGAIEVGLRILPEHPEVEPYVIRLIEQLRDDECESSTSAFKLFEALFVLVDGELSRMRLMSTQSPFYRRLASLSQAALIHGHFVALGVEGDPFCGWALENYGQKYYLQALSDMRREPRWNPDLATARQLKSECLGRVLRAASLYEANLEGREIHRLILGTGPKSIYSLCCGEFPATYFPGPLEGAEDSLNALPTELSNAIEAQLTTDQVGPTSFVGLVNSAMIFRVDSWQAELAAKVLKLANYRLANMRDSSELFGTLKGLAIVAAAGREICRLPMNYVSLRVGTGETLSMVCQW